MAKQELTKTKEVKAHARYIHVSPRKLRLLADLIRQERVDVALEQLRFSSKKAAQPLTKVVNSAIANAVHNFNLPKENLFIKSITVDGGPVIKKYTPRAQGRAFIERKRTSHINVVLEARQQQVKKQRRNFWSMRPRTEQALKPQKPEQVEHVDAVVAGEQKITKPKQYVKPAQKIKKHLVDLKRRLFNRKSGS